MQGLVSKRKGKAGRGVGGKASQGRSVGGKASQGRSVGGKASQGRSVGGKASQGRRADTRRSAMQRKGIALHGYGDAGQRKAQRRRRVAQRCEGIDKPG